MEELIKEKTIRQSFLKKCQYDCYIYYAFINQIGWVEFHEADLTDRGTYILNGVKFLVYPSCRDANTISGSAADPARGLEVSEKDIIAIVDCYS